MKIELYGLDKLSLNAWYSGNHWSKRKTLKDKYKFKIRNQTKHVQLRPCKVKYHFEFEKRLLDASNCVAMVKLIEDVIFPDDSPKIVKQISITSRKGLENKVTVVINEIDNVIKHK